MFKKIEIWILYLTLLLALLFAIGFGVLVRQELVGSVKAGWISKTALILVETPINILKYLQSEFTVEDRFPHLDGFNGTPNSEKSYLLLSRYDGDLQEGVVELIDLTNFKLLHSWNPNINAFNKLVKKVDEFKYLNRDSNNSRQIITHPKLTKDGGLIFGQFIPLTKIDSCSDLIFQNTRDEFHHSIEIDSENNIWVPSKLYPQTIDSLIIGDSPYKDSGYHDDALVKLSNDGKMLFEKSLSEIFIENGLKYLLFAHGEDYEEDPLHLNDIQPVNNDGNFWKKGDVFLSIRNQSMVVLYRPSTNKIIWKGTGPFLHQHDVNILDDRRISVFNNRSMNIFKGKNIVDGHNEIIIYDFESDSYSSYLSESLVQQDVRSATQGRGKILSNGDLFIEESNYGRTLYFNADGTLRWTHVNRSNSGNVYRVGWSRILKTKEDFQIVNNFLSNKGACNE
jgi:hypothetical protein